MELTLELGDARGQKLVREAENPVRTLSESARCNMDPDHLLGIVGIVGTALNLLVVVLVYIYTPV